MNYRMIFRFIGNILLFEALLLCFPFAVALINGENGYLSYILPIFMLAVLVLLLKLI